ncbi:Protein TEX261, partial [Geodia barretti]
SLDRKLVEVAFFPDRDERHRAQGKKTVDAAPPLFAPSFFSHLVGPQRSPDLHTPTNLFSAAGLYYLAELIEEYSVLAKKVITFAVLCVVVMHLGLWLIDGFPVLLVLTAVLAHLCYGSLLSTFPLISLLSPGFLAGTVFLLVSHYLAFQYFATEWHPFQEVLAFFFCGLWMVPFAFFISLSANDLVLPTQSPGIIHNVCVCIAGCVSMFVLLNWI